ncbi:restriction endonuclease [Pseudodesulfovibrio tunisiensis]|uniref:restriction endonuclease n=1 Tax=Pseudodesulfovibrio tunisiensis TaxID=463192 RepID=UPI001FB2A168|nr:restriction endonuclease [Pseudodesulfovibrio tunisiensis]
MKQKYPEFVQWFAPLLDALRDLGDSGKPREISDRIARKLNLPDKILDAVNEKSGGNKFYNQVAWARQYLVWEGLLDSSKYGTWKLTDEGKKTHLTENEAYLIVRKWQKIKQRKPKNETFKKTNKNEIFIPHEENGSSDFLNLDLIDVLRSLSPDGFERICKEVLRESDFENVEVTRKGGDEGIDGFGTLKINPFVSFKVIFQCKRYKKGNTVSRAQVGDFRNAMIGRAEKGIMITTSTFSQEAIKEANRDGADKIELVDGEKLVEMFEKVELGLTKKTVYEIDHAFFSKFK